MSKQITYTIPNANRATVELLAFDKDADATGGIRCRVRYQLVDDAGAPFGQPSIREITLTTAQRNGILAFIDNTVLPFIDSEEGL